MGGFVIQHNLSAINAQRTYGIVADRNSKSAEKLSSGYKINRAADDAASLAISEKMRRQIRGLRQAEDNIQDGISFVQVADGALHETHDILQRMNELCVKGANDTLTDDDRSYINLEIQAIKKESQRIFDTTSFNDRYIWNVDIPNPVLIGYDPTQALTVSDQRYGGYSITSANKDYMPVPGTFKASADEPNGVKVGWTGFDGESYSSDYISWNDLASSNYDFNIAEHLSNYSGDKLTALKGFLNNTIHMNVEPTTATIADYVAALNNATLSTYYSNYASATFKSPSNTSGITASATINVYAKEASSNAASNPYVFGASTNDNFIEPTSTNGTNLSQRSGNGTTSIETAKTSTGSWKFNFNMTGVGSVTAESNSITFSSNDQRAENENVWWYTYNGTTYTKTHTATKTGLAGVMEALTGSTGVLSEANGGDTNASGNIYIHFSLTSDSAYSYGNGSTSNSVGNMTINIPVTTSDTEQSILDKVNAALNANTVIDLSQNGTDYFEWYAPSEKTSTVQVPVYGGQIELIIQSGADADNIIPIRYDKLNNGVLGIRDIEITTSASARAGIDTIKSALNVVSEQRSLFGAYQNKLEHAYLNDNNIRINTQDAESKIRDTDMAMEMVNYSLTNILKQSGQSMMAQANQSKQGVMALLQ